MIKELEKKKLIAIVGTNASGKSEVGINAALQFNGEIISADSRQIYKGFDLCSGKISQKEADLVTHHMIDVIDIGTCFSVADYKSQTDAIINDIYNRNHFPFIVGGTGLYVDAVTNGYVFCDEKKDISFSERLQTLSIEELTDLLSPDGFCYLSQNPSDIRNRRRIIRVLEKEHNGLPLKAEVSPQYRVLKIGITWPKDILCCRVKERLEKRIKLGMIDEVKNYLDSGGNPQYLIDLGLEYKYIYWYLQGNYSSMDEFKECMAIAIMRFAKKQMSWFKRDKTIHWLNMSENYMLETYSMIDSFMKS